MTDDCGIPEVLRPGLDLFAATWLQAWANAGGSVFLDAEGNAQVGFPPEDPTVERATPYDLPDGSLEYDKIVMQDGVYIGRIRALLDLLQAMPRGADAVKLHMRDYGMGIFLSGRRGRF